ncbi:MAG: ECF transporter S component [Bellilinea sp.]
MPQDRTRKIVVTGVLGAIAVLLGLTRLGFIPWFTGASLTIMHVPVIIGAVLEGPLVGAGIGLIFGVFSMIQANIPNGFVDPLFKNPLISVLPRLLIGPLAWLVWSALKRWPVAGLISSGVVGSLTNTIAVLGIIGLLNIAPWAVLAPIAVGNGLPEAGAAALITLVVVAAWQRFAVGKQRGANI